MKRRERFDALILSLTDVGTNLLGVCDQPVDELHLEADAPQRQRRQQLVDARGSEGEGHLSCPRSKKSRIQRFSCRVLLINASCGKTNSMDDVPRRALGARGRRRRSD